MLRGCFQGEGAPRLAEGKRQAHQATPPSVPGGEPDVQECSPASRFGQGGGRGKAPCPSLSPPRHWERSVRPSVGLATRTLSTSKAEARPNKTTWAQCSSPSLPSPRPRSLSGGPSFLGVTCRSQSHHGECCVPHGQRGGVIGRCWKKSRGSIGNRAIPIRTSRDR